MNHRQRRVNARRKERESRPLVRINMAMSLDGHVVMPHGSWKTTSSEDHRRMDRHREWADCVVISRSTLLNDNPNLFIRNKPNSNYHPVPVIVMRKFQELPSDLRLWKKPHPAARLIATGEDDKTVSHPPNLSSLPEGVDCISIKGLSALPMSLHRLGYRKVLIEGGPQLNTYLMAEGLVDELCLTLTPLFVGTGKADRVVNENVNLQLKKMKLIRSERRGNELFLRYCAI